MTLEDLLHLTRQRFGSLALAIMICVPLSVAFALMTPNSYTATTQAYLRVEVGGDPGLNTQSHYNAVQLADSEANAAVPAFTSETVTQRVIESLKLDVTPEELASSVSATRTPETVSVQVSVKASTSRQTQVLADEIVRQTAEEVIKLEGSDPPVKISLLSSAELVSATRSPALVTCVGVGLLAELVLGYVWTLIQELLDKSLRGPEDVRKAPLAPVFGVLPEDPSPLRLGCGAQTEVEERLRAICTNVLHALSHGARQVVVVISTGPREGASTIAAGLARVLALSDHRVVLVGGDLCSPSAAGAPDAPGLAEALVGTARLNQVLVEGEVSGLELLLAGDMPGNPFELLDGRNMNDPLHHLAADRIVTIDAPPVYRFTDAMVLAEYAGRVLLVTRAGCTSAEEFREVVLAVGQGGGHMLGVVLTNVSDPGRGSRSVQAGVTHAESVTVQPFFLNARHLHREPSRDVKDVYSNVTLWPH